MNVNMKMDNAAFFLKARRSYRRKDIIIIVIILAGMAVFNVAGYLIEERHRWPIINASPRGQCSK